MSKYEEKNYIGAHSQSHARLNRIPKSRKLGLCNLFMSVEINLQTKSGGSLFRRFCTFWLRDTSACKSAIDKLSRPFDYTWHLCFTSKW